MEGTDVGLHVQNKAKFHKPSPTLGYRPKRVSTITVSALVLITTIGSWAVPPCLLMPFIRQRVGFNQKTRPEPRAWAMNLFSMDES